MTCEDLALGFVPQLGVRGIAHLIEIYGSGEAIYRATADELIARAQLRPDIARSIASKVGLTEAEREMEYCSRNKIDITAATDSLYPAPLYEISDRPHILYSMGDLGVLNSKHILSVVGTRRITTYGSKICLHLITELAQMFPDLVVVSGLAYGTDSHAHRAALAAKVPTVGVIANSLPHITPSEHTALAKDMIESGGAVISELHSQTKQNGNLYIPRNRIVAGLAEGLLVVESAANGGSLSTTKTADSYGRTIMAVPGRIGDAMSVGTNHLIKSNLAQMVISAEDIAAALGWQREESISQHLYYQPREVSPRDAAILSCFADENTTISLDDIADKVGISTAEASAILLDMELSGLVRQLPGKFYQKY